MADGTFRGARRANSGDTGPAAGDARIEWTDNGELLLAAADGSSRVAGGMLLEVAPPSPSRVGETGLMRLAPHEDMPGGPDAAVRSFVTPNGLTVVANLDAGRASGATLHATIRNDGATAVRLRRFFPFVTGAWWQAGSLSLSGRGAGFSAYKNGWQSWSYAGGLPLGNADPRPRNRTLTVWHSPGGTYPRSPHGGAADVVSEEVGLIGASDLPIALLAGFLSANHWLGQVYADRKSGAFAAAVLLDGHELAPREQVEMPALRLALGPQGALLPDYADAVALELHARPSGHVHTGWCSWYYYFTGVTEAAVQENLRTTRAAQDTLPVDLVQIDDGYQTAIGDWLSVNGKFPSGMAAVAERIREAGFRPGIWLAPFTVAANSMLARSHSDWLVRDATGKPAYAGHNWDVDLHALDTTHPGARDWLRQVFSAIVREWGYDYLKLDFLACAALPGTRHDPTATRASALRDGLRLIREAVGDEVYILGCGCPLLSAVGIVDAMRIGPDSAPYWPPRYEGLPVPFSEGHPLPTMEGAVRNTLSRAWMHPALWTNDPDCLLVREAKSELTLDEVQAFATAVGLTGGMVVVSDRLQELPRERLDIVAKLLPPLPARALPLDYFGAGMPERVAVTLGGAAGEVHLVGLFNPDRRDREVAVRWESLGLARGTYHASEFWSETYLGRSSDGVTLRLNPHGAAVLAIRRATGEPALLSTSFHISQGAVDVTDWSYDADRGMVRWRSTLGRTARGHFLLWLPPDVVPGRIEGGAGPVAWRRRTSGEVVVTADVRGEAQFALELAKM
jgi:alpha-galactosidase